jgi:prepilin-type N-terminal cleavage/methylation domain-containing protein
MNRRHAKSWVRSSGFSLLEMLVVLAGAGIIAAIAVPILSEMSNNYNSVFGAQEISTQLHFAKLKAISSNESLRVHFPDNNSYQIELSDGTLLKGPYFLPRDISINSADSGGVTFPGRYVTFQPAGTVPATGNGSAGRVKLISSTGLHVDVLVEGGGSIRQTPPYKDTSAPF